MGENILYGIFLERQADKLGRKTVFLKLIDEGSNVVFRTAGDERYLGFANDNRSN